MNQVGITLSISTVAGAAAWALSPWLTGYPEPWDAAGIYYPVALLVLGAVAGILSPQPLWAHYLGAFIGQLGYEVLFLGAGPLLVLGVAFLLGYAVIFFVGAVAGAQLCAHLKHRRADD